MFYYSYCNIFELSQDYSKEYKEDRIRRVETIKKICGNNSFRCFIDLKNVENGVSPIGDWFPESVKECFNMEMFVHTLKEAIADHPHIDKRVKKKCRTNSGFRTFYRKNGQPLALQAAKFHFSEEFEKQNVVYRYICNEIPKDIANKLLLDMIRDPYLFLLNFFDVGQFENHFTKPFHSVSKHMHDAVKLLSEISKNVNISDFDVRNHLSQLPKLFPDYIFDIFNIYINYNIKNPHFQESDAADIMHALYIPHCDIWRGDSHFSHILKESKYIHSNRIISKLRDLPRAIQDSAATR